MFWRNQMINELRKHIMFVFAISLTLVLCTFLIVFYMSYNQRYLKQDSATLRRYVVAMESQFMDEFDDQTQFEGTKNYFYDPEDFCSVDIKSDGKILSTIIGNNVTYSQEDLEKYALEVFKSKSKKGNIANLVFQMVPEFNNVKVIFYDRYGTSQQLTGIVINSVIFLLVGIALFFVISYFLSKRIVIPVEERFMKQKQFVSDASHELKTPLAVIQANADLLESEAVGSKWVGYIKDETVRMSNLIEQLLTLTRIDTANKTDNFEMFDCSDAIMSVALPFESVAFESSINYEIRIDPNIHCYGVESEIKQVAAIFLDNALKHTPENGSVKISLQKYSFGREHIKIVVRNTGESIPVEERSKIFDRFYRVDKSRNRSQGRYGLGLAIAKSIVEKHDGKISVDCKSDWIIFTANI